MAPPETPSPRRFLPASSSRRQPSPTKSAKPPSRLVQSTTAAPDEPVRIATHAQHLPPPPRPQPYLPPPNGSQFAPTPRFSLVRPKPTASAQQQRQDAASPPRSSLAHALRLPRVREDVEDTASSPPDIEPERRNNEDNDDDEEMLLTAEPGEVVQPSIETPYLQRCQREQVNDSGAQNDTEPSPSSPKRRRLETSGGEDPDVLLSPGRHRSRMSEMTATANTVPRFAPLAHSAVPDPTSSISATPSIHRPSFLRPPTPPAAPLLPQAFSPHRRRGAAAFVPGGVASTVQAWVVEAGAQRGGVGLGKRGPNSQPFAQVPRYLPHQHAQSGTWGFRVRVERAEAVVGGSGGWRVWGCRDGGSDGERVRCLLVGEENGNGKGVVSEGAIVGVSRGGLGWEVDAGVDRREGGDDGTWWVGVGWDCGGG